MDIYRPAIRRRGACSDSVRALELDELLAGRLTRWLDKALRCGAANYGLRTAIRDCARHLLVTGMPPNEIPSRMAELVEAHATERGLLHESVLTRRLRCADLGEHVASWAELETGGRAGFRRQRAG